MSSLVFAVVSFVVAMLVFTLAWWAAENRRESYRLRMLHRLGVESLEAPVLRLRRQEENGLARSLRDLLERAGDHDSLGHLALRMAIFGLAGLIVSVWLLVGPAKALGALGVVIPLLILRSRAIERDQQLTLQLPDALDRIARTLRAGHAFSDALRLAAEELPPPIGEELARVSEAHRLGVELRDVLEDLAARNSQNFDIRLFVGAVLLHRDTGGNLVEILEHLTETLRERTIFHQKVRALTAEVKVSAWILGALPFLVAGALLAVAPDYLLPLLEKTSGHWMLLGAGASLVLGASLMRRLARVEV